MIKPKVAFIVYGVHKDGLRDPLGELFIDELLLQRSRKALEDAGLELIVHDVVLATKEEAKACFSKYKKMDDLDAVVLFSGTWVWAAHLIGAIRDFSFSGKGIVIWTHPGSQGWRPVGGVVMHGAMKEIGARLGITARTVAFHKYKMMETLELKTTAELVRFAVENRIA